MRIVLEGPDCSGKSTLAAHLSETLGIPIKAGEGPEKFPGEINQRVKRWLMERHDGHLIHDRHPCISHPIFSKYTGTTTLDPDLINQFYLSDDLILIYCHPHDYENHVVKPTDTQEHLDAINAHMEAIRYQYLKWAVDRADLIYDYKQTDLKHFTNMLKAVIPHGN